MSSCALPELREVLERPRGLELRDRVRTRLHVLGLLHRALHREPTSAISSPTPVAASEIRTCASAAEYCALMTSFFDRNASILVCSFCSLAISLLLLGLELPDLMVQRADLCLDCLLALQRRARQLLIARAERLARLPVELLCLLAQALLLQL